MKGGVEFSLCETTARCVMVMDYSIAHEGYLANYNRTMIDRGREGRRCKKKGSPWMYLLMTRLTEGAGKPLETLVQTVTRGSAS